MGSNQKHKGRILTTPKKVIFLLVSVILALMLTPKIFAESQVYENSFAKMTVTPTTAHSPTNIYIQDFEVENKKSQNGNLCVAYVFSDPLLSSNVWLEKTGIKQVWESNPSCYFEYDINGTSINICDDNGQYVNTDYNYFDNVKQYFSYEQIGNKHIYYSNTALNFDGYETHKWRVKYKTNSSSGKWDLKTWNTINNNCYESYFDDTKRNFLNILDPFFNNSWQYRKLVNITTEGIVQTPFYVALHNDSNINSSDGYPTAIRIINYSNDAEIPYDLVNLSYVSSGNTNVRWIASTGAYYIYYDNPSAPQVNYSDCSTWSPCWMSNDKLFWFSDTFTRPDNASINSDEMGNTWTEKAGASLDVGLGNVTDYMYVINDTSGSAYYESYLDFTDISTDMYISFRLYSNAVNKYANYLQFRDDSTINTLMRSQSDNTWGYHTGASYSKPFGYTINTWHSITVLQNYTNDTGILWYNGTNQSNAISTYADDDQIDQIYRSGSVADTFFSYLDFLHGSTNEHYAYNNPVSYSIGSQESDNTKPTVSVTTSPSTVFTDNTVIYTLNASDDDGDTVNVTWTIEFVNGTDILTGWNNTGNFTITLDSAYFVRNNTVNISALPYDGKENGTANQSTFTVSNTIPIFTSVSYTPTIVYTNNDIIFVINSSDIDVSDGDSINISFNFTVDGIGVYGSVNTSLNFEVALGNGNFTIGQTVNLTLNISDGFSSDYNVTSIVISPSTMTCKIDSSPRPDILKRVYASCVISGTTSAYDCFTSVKNDEGDIIQQDPDIEVYNNLLKNGFPDNNNIVSVYFSTDHLISNLSYDFNITCYSNDNILYYGADIPFNWGSIDNVINRFVWTFDHAISYLMLASYIMFFIVICILIYYVTIK